MIIFKYLSLLKVVKPLIFIAVLLCFSCAGSRRITSTFNNAPAFETGFSGLVVYDPQKSKIIYSHNAHKYFTPASNIKLFTLYTGLMILNDSVPALKYGIHGDSLIFTGTGDPSLLNPDLPDSKVLNFFAENDKELFFHPPSEVEKVFGPGWSWDDYNSYYSVERTVFPIYGNRVKFKVDPVLSKIESFPISFMDSIQIIPGSTGHSRFTRDIAGNTFVFNRGNKMETFSQEVPFKYSQGLLVNLLGDTINKKVKILKELPENFKVNHTLYSIPADSMYKRMMEVSDNFIAEQILLLSANKLRDTLKSKIAIDYMQENFLKDLPDEVYWVDGSGLSRYNLVTPASMVKLLTKIYEIIPQERLFNLLATGGVSGTLKTTYIAEEPYIFAKTGTLRNNHSLSGYLKAKSGKILIFSFLNSNYTVPTSELKIQMEKILKEIFRRN